MLVLLHGFGGRPEVFDATRRALPASWASLALPLPGHDAALPLAGDLRFESAIEMIGARAPARFQLLGYSMGARLALAFTLAHRERVTRLHLIGVHPGLQDPAERAARKEADRGWAEILRTGGLEVFFEAWDRSPLFEGRARVSSARRSELVSWRRTHEPEQLARAMETLGLAEMPPLWSRLGEIGVATNLIVGEYDRKFRSIAEQMQAANPRLDLHVITGAGHDVPFEAPEALAALLRGSP